MEQGIIKRDRVRMNASATSAAQGARAQSSDPSERMRCAASKKVELVLHQGRARAIEFTCGCGEVTLIELAYDGLETKES